MAENVLLQRQNFQDKIIFLTVYSNKWSTLNRLKHVRKYKDVYLEFSNGGIAINSLVLAASSPVFEAMLYHNCKESIQRRINVNRLFRSFSTLKKFVDFLNGYSINLLENDVEDLLNVAVQYFIKDLENLCSQFLLNHLCSTNCLSIWLLSSMCLLPKLALVCQHLFWEVIPFIINDQRDIIENLPDWFLLNIILVSEPINFNPLLLPSFFITWMMGDLPMRVSACNDLIQKFDVSVPTLDDMIRDFPIPNSQKLTILNVLKAISKRHLDTNVLEITNNKDQYMSIMLVDKIKCIAAFFSMESRKWLMSKLPFFDGKTLGIISGNFLVRVTRGSSANLFNLITQDSLHTPCILSAVKNSKLTALLLPTENSYFISHGLLHVAVIVRSIMTTKFVIFVYNSNCNVWHLLARYPLSNTRHHTGLYTYSTVNSFVYFIINAHHSSLNFLKNPQAYGGSQVFVVDMKRLRVVGSVYGHNLALLGNDSFIMKQKIYFATNKKSLISSKDNATKVLQIDPFKRKYTKIDFPIVPPIIEALPFRQDQHQLKCTRQFTAVKESTLCMIYYKGPYLCSFFINDLMKRKWVQMSPPPPIFEFKHSKPSFIYTHQPVSSILQYSSKHFISTNERFFATLELDIDIG